MSQALSSPALPGQEAPFVPPPKLCVFSSATQRVETRYGPASGSSRFVIWAASATPSLVTQVRIVTPCRAPCAPISARAMCARASQSTSSPGPTWSATPSWLANDPVAVKSPASCPSRAATRASSSWTVGSSS